MKDTTYLASDVYAMLNEITIRDGIFQTESVAISKFLNFCLAKKGYLCYNNISNPNGFKQVSENILKNLECENSVFAAKIEFSHSIKVHKIN